MIVFDMGAEKQPGVNSDEGNAPEYETDGIKGG